MNSREGGCLCGHIRYRVSGNIIDSGYCHCRICQRSAGAPVLAWFTVETRQFHYSNGKPTSYTSSLKAVREFCRECGTQLVYRASTGDKVDITTASLDAPDGVEPQYHIWRSSRIAWFETKDALPRHNDSGPDWVP